jgi:hypothetical protein
MLRKFGIIVVLSLIVVALTASVAVAAVNIKGGSGAEPNFTDQGLSLAASGALSGLGNGDVIVSLSATGNATATCTNPAGATQPPGQNPAPVTLTGTQVIPETEVKNGNTPFDVSTTTPQSPIPGAPDCPNRKWTETITDVSFTTATLTVTQGGVIVFQQTYTFSPPTSNGAVPGGQVS